MYQKVDLLILDEWLLKPLTTQEAMDLFFRLSGIILSKYPVNQ